MTILTRSVGNSGLLVSAAGLGCNNFGRSGTATETLEGTRAVIDAAIASGVVFFDTADIYGKEPGLSETLMGAALKGRRDEVVLATKFGNSEYPMNYPISGRLGSRAYVRRAVEQSLTRLGTDWIDLYQLHSPDVHTPIEETLDALDELVGEGKIRYYGHSNFTGWQIAEAEYVARSRRGRFISAQSQFSLLSRQVEREVLPAVRRYGLGFFPFFPLHNGLLTGKFTREGGPAGSRIMRQRPHLWRDAPWDALEAYQRFCEERGVTMLEASYGWLLAQEGVASVIAGATTVEQIEANAAAAAAWTPSEEDVIAIDALFPLVADPAA